MKRVFKKKEKTTIRNYKNVKKEKIEKTIENDKKCTDESKKTAFEE